MFRHGSGGLVHGRVRGGPEEAAQAGAAPAGEPGAAEGARSVLLAGESAEGRSRVQVFGLKVSGSWVGVCADP